MPCPHNGPDWKLCQRCLAVMAQAVLLCLDMTLASILPEAATAVATTVLYNACMGVARLFSDSPAIHHIWLGSCVRLPPFMAEVAKIAAIPAAHATAYRRAVVQAVTLLFMTLGAALVSKVCTCLQPLIGMQICIDSKHCALHPHLQVIPNNLFPRSIAHLPAPPRARLACQQLTTHNSTFPSSVSCLI